METATTMNKKTKQARHKRRHRLALKKRAEKETYLMEQEVTRLQNKNTHIVKETSEKERMRIAMSMLPKEKIPIVNIKEYRTERRKRIKGVK